MLAGSKGMLFSQRKRLTERPSSWNGSWPLRTGINPQISPKQMGFPIMPRSIELLFLENYSEDQKKKLLI
jgi:hypothetical protein